MRAKIAFALVAVLGLVWVGIAAGAQFAGLLAPVALLGGLWWHARKRTSHRPLERVRPHRRESVPSQWLADLDDHASRALVDADDSVRTSEEELRRTTARIGERETAPFRAALDDARAELAAAFKLRQLLDDGIPQTSAVQQSMLLDINSRCSECSRLLDEQAAAFDQLQDLCGRGPRILAEADPFVDQQSHRLERSRHTLTQLASAYSPQAVETVAANPDLADELLQLASDQLATAARLLADGQPGTFAARHQVAGSLQVADASAGLAAELLDGIQHAEAELTQAASALPTALRETTADLEEAVTLLGDSPDAGPASALSRARAAVVSAASERLDGAQFDALAALRTVEQACAALDHALARSRAEPARQHRAEAILDQAMLVARSSVRAAEDFVATRRGAIGARARTRLAEAWRHFQQAIASLQADPRVALNEARQADALAHQASALAAHDVTEFAASPAGAGAPAASTPGPAAAVLGGILIGARSPDGVPCRDSVGPASFGGTATRGRHVPVLNIQDLDHVSR